MEGGRDTLSCLRCGLIVTPWDALLHARGSECDGMAWRRHGHGLTRTAHGPFIPCPKVGGVGGDLGFNLPPSLTLSPLSVQVPSWDKIHHPPSLWHPQRWALREEKRDVVLVCGNLMMMGLSVSRGLWVAFWLGAGPPRFLLNVSPAECRRCPKTGWKETRR